MNENVSVDWRWQTPKFIPWLCVCACACIFWWMANSKFGKGICFHTAIFGLFVYILFQQIVLFLLSVHLHKQMNLTRDATEMEYLRFLRLFQTVSLSLSHIKLTTKFIKHLFFGQIQSDPNFSAEALLTLHLLYVSLIIIFLHKQ